LLIIFKKLLIDALEHELLNPKWKRMSHSNHVLPLIFSGWQSVEIDENISMLTCIVCSRKVAPWNFLMEEESSMIADIPVFSPSKRVQRDESKDIEETLSKKPRIASSHIFEIGTLVKPVMCFSEGLASMDFCDLTGEESKTINDAEEELSLEELRCLSRMKKRTSSAISKPEFDPIKEHRTWCPWRNCDISKLLLSFCSSEIPKENEARELSTENGIERAKKTLSLVRSTLWSIPRIKEQFNTD
jgi:hypothetical protein